MLEQQYRFYVGIDWATEFHEVCVLDGERRVIDRKKVEHSGSGIAQFVEVLLKLSGNQPEQVAVAIEIPRGAVVETLVERKFHVHSLNPKQMDRFRDRHTVAGAKDDSLDAFVLVQREMEKAGSPLVSIPPCGRGFSRHGGLSIR